MGSSEGDSVAEHPSGSALPDLAWAITAGAVRLAAATASWLRLVAEFDERGGWHGVGINSCAHWLAWQCGLGPGAAREHVRVARALRSLPRIEAAFAAGRLSYSKVRALTRIAAPDCESALLDFAVCATASQTERFCRTWRRVDDDAQAGPRRPEERISFDYWTDEEGGFTLKIRGPAEAGAVLMAHIDSLAERDARRERAQAKKARARHEEIRAAGGTVDSDVAERCEEDATVGLARERTAARRLAALTSLAEARASLDRRPGDPPRREVVVHVDISVLADDTATGRAHFEGGPAVTGAQARRMLCEATVVAMIEAGREPLAVGRRRRRATKAQHRALLRRDGGCARPGCPEARVERLHIHHLRHWLHGGRTDLDNLVLLCDADHGLVHDEDLVMTRRDGRLSVLTPDGRHIWGSADAAFTTGLDRQGTADDTAFIGVHPIDTAVGRRPSDARPTETVLPALNRQSRRRRHRPVVSPRRPAARPGDSTRPIPHQRRRTHTSSTPAALRARLDAVLFPDGPPDLRNTIQDHYDRMDLRYAIGVLMDNRDLVRRLAAEAGVSPTGCPAFPRERGR